MKIKEEVLQVLNESVLNNNILYLPPRQLDRKLYVDVNKVLELLGGKWNRSLKGHKFDADVDEMLNDAINYGEVIDHQKELQFFRTPENIAKILIDLAKIGCNDICLEPSCGDGALLRYMPANSETQPTRTYAIEIDPVKVEKLRKIYNNTPIKCCDFLEVDNSMFYDRVIMNPPFSKQQDIKHILHAFGMLKEGGILVSVVSESVFFRNNKLSVEFREWLSENNSEQVNLESGAFKESGTMVKTRIIIIRK